MPPIDPELLRKAMAKAPMGTKELAERVNVSITYMSDIVHGRRTLKRNPALRRAIAIALDVPQHWIEEHQP